MHPLVKAGIGLVLMIVTVAAVVYDYFYGLGPLGKLELLKSLVIVLKGTVPPMLFLLGFFIFWLEIDEWKIEKELEAEEEKEEEEKKKPKKKKK